ncbi:MAG: hypothetical protein Q8O67_27220 [Deltaproteobacteria bacterium]|nr:hypothetical protein [Deltaproteobacteria bacterium]
MPDEPTLARKKTTPTTPAALRSTTTTPSDWRTVTQQLLLVLGIAATLPRAIWLGVSAGFDVFGYEWFGPLIFPLRTIGLAAGALVVVVVWKLGTVLDAREEGRSAAALRALALWVLAAEILWGLLQPTVGEVAGDWLMSAWFQVLFFVLVPAVADIVFALWIAAMLTTQRVQPFLPGVVILSIAFNVIGFFAGFPRPLHIGVDFVVVVSTLIEILRLRRALS